MTITISLRRTTLKLSLATPSAAGSAVTRFVTSSLPGSATLTERLSAAQ